MDAAELARQRAAALHTEAVSSGLNPFEPYAFALAEAKRRDILVEKSRPGGTMLGNSRATYIQALQLIVHENMGTPFEQAFLIVHEIGHSELGDDEDSESPLVIDPARPSESSPVGIDRVVDYGRKQRREVQMDLFAREFLLPREFVHKLHIDEKLTATQIAERLGAPFEVVAQQLLDALLLPRVELEAKKASIERPPNDLQQTAATHRGSAYLLEAGPGTGKTQTLVTRVEGLLADGVDPRRILLLTFSNKAAGEMAERIARKNKDAAAAMWIGTFHAFGLDIIRRFHHELGLPKDPRLLDRTEAVEILENEFPRLGLKHYRNLYDPTQIISDILAAISRAKDEVIDEKQYVALAQAMIEKATTNEDREMGERALEVAKVYETYEKLKRAENCVDFGDLVSMPVRLLESNEAIRSLLGNLYDHVLVDEYQDVNRSSVRLLVALRGSGENLWAVGDAKQSIYRFRGASSFNMERFGRGDFVGGKRGRLKINYRSVSEIVTMYSAFAVGMKVGDSNSGLESYRGPSGKIPELLNVVQEDEQSVVLAESIEAMRSVGHDYKEQVLLCTGNEKLSKLGQTLERLGIPVLFLGSLFERPEIKELLSMLSILTDRRATGLVRVASGADFGMPIGDVCAVLDYFSANELEAGHWIRSAHEVPGISEEAKSALKKLATTLNGFNTTDQPWEVLAKLLFDRTATAAGIATSQSIQTQAQGIAIWQFMNFVRVQPVKKGLPIVRLLERVRRLLRLGDDRDLRQLPAAAQGLNAVRLMTIHGSKGLEFEVVHLPGFNTGTIPRAAKTPPCPPPDGMVEGGDGKAVELFKLGEEEEQECLFYVAMSRAKDRFIAYAPTKQAGGRSRGLSPFLPRLSSSISQRRVKPATPLPADPEEAAISLSIDGALNFRGEQVALFENCPRRFFYTHVLRIGGRMTRTPFLQMHDVVRDVFKGVVSGGVLISTPEHLNQRVEAAFKACGLSEHGYVNDYQALALPMLRYFNSLREGHTPEEPKALKLTFKNESVLVLPDDVLLRPDGKRTIRKVRTGHRPKSTEDIEDVEAAALILAAKEAFPDAIVEIVFLSDQKIEPLSMTATKLENRKAKLDNALDDIRSGKFPPEPSIRSCPGCPAFFVCGPVPKGVLQKTF